MFEKGIMTGEQEDLVKSLKDRVHMLMAKYSALKKEYSQVILENENLQKQVSVHKNRIEVLEKQYNSAKMASGVLVNEEDKEMARAEINRIVREIDSCIALLNR